MENLWIYFTTIFLYSGVWYGWYLVKKPKGCREFARGFAKRLTLLAVLCLPFNIKGNIVTVLGNGISEKSMYSLCSVYQRAGKDAVSLIGVAACQKAGRDAMVGIGGVGYQKAGRDAMVGIGGVGYQKAGRDAVTRIGVAACQKAGRDAMVVIGIACFQKAARNAGALLGVGFYQVVPGGKKRVCGAVIPLTLMTEGKE